MDWSRSLLVVLGVLHFGSVENARILGVWPEQGLSHFVMFERLMKGLVAKGHEVDVLSHFPQKDKIPGYNDLSVKGSLPSWTNNISMDLVYELGFWGDIHSIFQECGVELCETIFNTEAAQNLLKTDRKYDLLVTEIFGTDCFLGYAHHFRIPSVLLTTSVNLPWSGDRIGLTDNPSYIPNYFMPYLSEMGFFERMQNAFVVLVTKIGFNWISTTGSNLAAKRYFGADLPDLRVLASDVSLLLANSHLSVNFARPTVPNFVEVGGLHLREPEALSKYFQEMLKTDQKGVIYLSMGSMMQTETFAFDKLQAMFDSFGEIPYKVVWKAKKNEFNSSLTIPKNVHFEEWMPQMDILCHPNVKLFISHGGALGGQEAVYCGVPRLGIPLFADQELNIRASETAGVAIRVGYHDITKETFSGVLKQLLYDEKYSTNSKKMAKIFKDRPLSALDTAIYWIEYVIRHEGASHLRIKGADLPWYQFFLIDVIAFSGVAGFFLLWLIYTSIRFLCSLRTKDNNNKNSVKMGKQKDKLL